MKKKKEWEYIVNKEEDNKEEVDIIKSNSGTVVKKVMNCIRVY
jgi:hypothetical protein